MKRYFYALASLVLAATLISCEKDKYGAEAGHDSTPNVVLKAFSAELPNDPDCDARVRFAANNATTEVYYFAETAAQKEERNLSDEAYADYVVSNGTKLTVEKNSFDGSYVGDALLKSLYFENVITAVAVGKGTRSMSSTTFTGLKWKTLCKGTYTFTALKSLISPKTDVELQQQENDDSQYRFKDVYGTGNSLNFFVIDQTATDDLGTYTYARIPAQSTGLSHSKYGAISVRDVGYWQGDDAWITENGYESCFYENYLCYMYAQYYVKAGSLGYKYDKFVPNE